MNPDPEKCNHEEHLFNRGNKTKPKPLLKGG